MSFRRASRAVALAGSFSVVLTALAASGSGAAASEARPATVDVSDSEPASYNGLALTPPMGYSDWYRYGCGVTAAEMSSQAESLVSTGLSALGYKNVNVDDCWMASNGGPTTVSPTFGGASGMQSLVGEVHGLGLTLGLYQSVGPTTCQNNPGLYPSSYQSAADTFASWGIDFLKLDYCGMSAINGNNDTDNEPLFQGMSKDLLTSTSSPTGGPGGGPPDPIVYSEELPVHEAADMVPALSTSGSGCQEANVPTVAEALDYQADISDSASFANMWRVAPDLTPPSASTTASPYVTGSCSYARSVISHFELDLFDSAYARPGAWNDLDFLGAGYFDNPKFFGSNAWTTAEAQSQMSIWAEMASPLIMSNDLTSIPSADLAILSNQRVIEVDQDPLGRQGRLVAQAGPIDVVSRPLANGNSSILFVNTSSAADDPGPVVMASGSGPYTFTNLWTGAVTANSTGAIDPGSIAAYGTAMYTASPGSPDTTLSNPLGLCDYGGTWCIEDPNGAASSGQAVSMEQGSPSDDHQAVTFTLDTDICNDGEVDAATSCPWLGDTAADSHYNGDDIWQIEFPDAGSQGPDYWCLAGAEKNSGVVLGTCASAAQNNLWVAVPLQGVADGNVGLLNVYKLSQAGGTECQCLDAGSNAVGTQPVVDPWTTGTETQRWVASAPLPGQTLNP